MHLIVNYQKFLGRLVYMCACQKNLKRLNQPIVFIGQSFIVFKYVHFMFLIPVTFQMGSFSTLNLFVNFEIVARKVDFYFELHKNFFNQSFMGLIYNKLYTFFHSTKIATPFFLYVPNDLLHFISRINSS